MGDRTIFEKKKDGTPKFIWDAIPKMLILDKDVSADSFKLYCVLVSYINIDQNHDEHVFPSYMELKAVTGYNRNKIAKCINELVGKGWIENITNPIKFNFQNNFYLNNSPKINKALIERRNKKHNKIKEKALERNSQDSK